MDHFLCPCICKAKRFLLFEGSLEFFTFQAFLEMKNYWFVSTNTKLIYDEDRKQLFLCRL